ncbi:NAD(P)-dependent alcohol dehydrogenase [Cellulomonas humilata]|uniref:NADPH:quinone reductase-like Zn-dependent oxidoreductase n=1 Tax=Cellulomonas humilata TaxID=144055 RepID=A0ABU0EC35_9CELL|nr:NAD(P)-dependent alcohol dehydrogenase [Cellulomonas humilata]MDQ0372830.1 NADPH:quinone reductase-like Zn-dependent oxidoreductase [Cellulomonas humilata]
MDARTETRTMQAITQRAYGTSEVLTFGTVPRPVPKADEVLIRVRASSLNFADKAMITGRPSLVRAVSGLRRPKHPVPGKDVAGVVEEVGANVTDLRPGDEVFAEAVAGAWAQYVSVPAKLVAPKPANLTFEQAATLPLAAGTALDCVAGVRSGQKVLVNGASGGVGTFAVQLATALGAEVTGVCSGRNVELVRGVGADHVIDYERTDFTSSGARYDLIIDLVSNRNLTAYRRALTPHGTLHLSGSGSGRVIGPMARLVQALVVNLFVGQHLKPVFATASRAKLDRLRELAEAGSLTPAIERTYPLSDAPEALRRQMAEHARGKTVITVAEER